MLKNSFPTVVSLNDFDSGLQLLQKLIQDFPTYASRGIDLAQDKIFDFMKGNGWNQVYSDVFFASSLQNEPDYVDVTALGPHYSSYNEIPKRNIIGIIEGILPGPTLILNGHVDVDLVTSPEKWFIKDGWKSGEVVSNKMYGRGACDMLSGLVALLVSANIFFKYSSQWCGRIILTAVTDEEIGGNGTLRSLLWLKEKGYLEGSVECLIAEPSNQLICASSLGFLHIMLDIPGIPVHMGVALKENNALSALLQLLKVFDDLFYQAAFFLNPKVSREQLISNFGIIHGGQDPAIPIADLHLEGTLFFPADLDINFLSNEIQKRILLAFPLFKVQTSAFGFGGSGERNSSFLDCLFKSQSFPGKNREKGFFPSPCDARLYNRYNIPTVIYGPGFLAQAHAVDEHICLNELKEYIDHITGAIFDFMRVGGSRCQV